MSIELVRNPTPLAPGDAALVNRGGNPAMVVLGSLADKDDDILLTWPFLSDAYSEVPAEVGRATVEGEDGDVLSYTLQGVTRFRFIPDDYDPTLDAFYAEFDGTDLSGLIVARG